MNQRGIPAGDTSAGRRRRNTGSKQNRGPSSKDAGPGSVVKATGVREQRTHRSSQPPPSPTTAQAASTGDTSAQGPPVERQSPRRLPIDPQIDQAFSAVQSMFFAKARNAMSEALAPLKSMVGELLAENMRLQQVCRQNGIDPGFGPQAQPRAASNGGQNP